MSQLTQCITAGVGGGACVSNYVKGLISGDGYFRGALWR